jgi:hypothetical protein
LDEGRVRVALERRLQLAVQDGEPVAGAGGLGGELADQPGGDAFAGDGDRLLAGGGERFLGELFGVPARDAAGPEDVLDQPAPAGAADLRGVT